MARVPRKIASFLAKQLNESSFLDTMKGSLRKSEDADKMKKLKDELKSAYDCFTVQAKIISHTSKLASMQVKSSIRIKVAIQKMSSKADICATRLSHLTRRMTYRTCIDKMHAVLSLTYSTRFDARESPDGCLIDTRTKILHLLDDWVADSKNSLSVFCLPDMAETGKSTIAKTFCQNFSNCKYLAASYIISRQCTTRSDTFSLVRTLAYKLTGLRQSILDHICRVVQNQPGITDGPMEEQTLALVTSPLMWYLTTNAPCDPLVIVVDALDECSKTADCAQLVRFLTSHLADLSIKLLVTSRNEKYLRDAFSSVPHESLKLHDLEQGMVSADVRRFFEANLTRVALEGMTAD